MNKLEEYKWKLIGIDTDGTLQDAYTVGFDAAIALDLPVKFATWRHNHNLRLDAHRKLWEDILKWNKLKPPSISELYQYWIDNIYKP